MADFSCIKNCILVTYYQLLPIAKTSSSYHTTPEYHTVYVAARVLLLQSLIYTSISLFPLCNSLKKNNIRLGCTQVLIRS